MKSLFSFFVFVTLVTLVSCKNIDETLVSQMQETVSSMQAQTGDFDMNTQGMASFAQLVETAPAALKADTASGFPALREKVLAVSQKQERTVTEFKEVLNELDKKATEYAAGKITTEEARSSQETLGARLSAIKELLAQVGKLNDEAQTEYGKMMAEYRSKTE